METLLSGEWLHKLLSYAIGLSFPLVILLMWWQRRRDRLASRTKPEPEDDSPLIGTEEDLRRAEAEVAGTTMDDREALLVDHVLYDRFSTIKGYSETYMQDLVDALAARGIHSAYIFQQSMPIGYGSITHAHGLFEFYVYRDNFEEADRILKEKLGRS